MNKIFLTGNLGRDVNITETSTGLRKAAFSVACKGLHKDKDGNAPTYWFDCTAWGDTADRCAANLRKGTGVVIYGEMQIHDWVGKDGEKRTSYSINVDSVGTMLPGNRSTGNWVAEEEKPQQFGLVQDDNLDLPF